MDQLPLLGKRELICLLLFTCNYVVSVRRGDSGESILMSTHNIVFILMSTHNIVFYEDLTKIIFELSSNIIKYAPYFFC